MDTSRPQLLDFQFHQNNDSFTLHFQQRLILTHSKDNPCLWIGSGIADIDMFRGNFSIKDKLQEKIALTDAIVSQSPDGWLIHFSRGSDISATLNISADDQGRLLLELQNDNLNHNRILAAPCRSTRGPYLRLRRTVFLLRSAWQTVPAMDQ